MSNEDDDNYVDDQVDPKPRPNGGGAVSDEDIQALLDQEREKTRRLEADRNRERTERSRVEAQVSTHQTARFDAEEQAVAARIAAADSTASGLRRDYALAMQEGKFDEVAEIQDKLAELRAKQQGDRQYKTWLENEKTRLAAAPPPQQQVGIDLSQYSAAQRAWIRKHPEFMEDEQLRRRTFAAHQVAEAEGIEVDSPEYFEVIDEIALRGRKKVPVVAPRDPEDDGAGHEGTPPPAPRRERVSTEVPVTRSQPGERGQRYKVLPKLTSGEEEAADFTLAEHPAEDFTDDKGVYHPSRYRVFARNKEMLKRQGRL